VPRTRTAAALAVLASFLLLLSACSSGSSSKSGSSAPPASAPSSAGGGQASAKLAVTHPTVWLCRPGMANNPCEGNLDATDVGTGNGTTVQPFKPATDPKIDCFYVYPTASNAKTMNAPLEPEPATIGTARAQVARFASTCRVFAPVYRQLTVASIANGSYGNAQAQALAAGDVDSAWHDYLNTYNQGRGVVLIGHSQGAGELQRLIRSEIDNNPAERSKLVSAILLGGNVLVPQGKDVGGIFANIPACRKSDQTGCVVAYSSFAQAPPPNSLFARAAGARNLVPGVQTDNMQVLCVNPVTLGAGSAELHPYLPTPHIGGSINAAQPPGLPDIKTAFVTFSGLRAECVNSGGASYLHVTGSGSPYLAAATTQAIGPTWGLHLLDVSNAYGDLVSLVSKQAAAWK
jgi:hypothetical protein